MLAYECKLGDKIKILDPGYGAMGCSDKIGYITNKKNNHGKSLNKPGVNVELENGTVWRIDPDAEVSYFKNQPIGEDPIKPSYYNDTKITPFDVIDDWSLNFYLGNAIKYIKRAGKKDGNSRLQDLKKVREYIDHEIKAEEVKQ